MKLTKSEEKLFNEVSQAWGERITILSSNKREWKTAENLIKKGLVFNHGEMDCYNDNYELITQRLIVKKGH